MSTQLVMRDNMLIVKDCNTLTAILSLNIYKTIELFLQLIWPSFAVLYQREKNLLILTSSDAWSVKIQVQHLAWIPNRISDQRLKAGLVNGLLRNRNHSKGDALTVSLYHVKKYKIGERKKKYKTNIFCIASAQGRP